MQPLFLVRIQWFFFLTSLPNLNTEKAWTHGWNSALDSQFIDFGYKLMSSSQASFVASHYKIVSIEKCTGSPKITTEMGFYASAQQLKAIDPQIKVLFYWNVKQVSLTCYAAAEQFLSQPSWWLRDDTGAFVNISAGIPYLDTTVAAARSWWAHVPLNGTWAALMDGVLADGTGSICPSSKMSFARCQAYISGRSAMIQELQSLLNSTVRGGIVLGNGIQMTRSARPTGTQRL